MYSFSSCTNGIRNERFGWSPDVIGEDGELTCIPDENIVGLMQEMYKVKCKGCTEGQSRDQHGNCLNCGPGSYQPTDLSATYFDIDQDKNLNTPGQETTSFQDLTEVTVEPFTCTECPAGHFAPPVVEFSEFDSFPNLFL